MSEPQWSTLFIKGFTVIDSTFICSSRGLVGESWLVDITLKGTLNDESMIFDFGLVKKSIKSIIDNVADHKLIVPLSQAGVTVNRDSDNTCVTGDFKNESSFIVKAPESAFYFLAKSEITHSSIQHDLEQRILAEMPDNVKEISISLRSESLGHEPYYHYSHGLKKHHGNCQRIVHGHRSKIEIYENGNRSEKLQNHWEQRWKDIYLITEEDLTSYQCWPGPNDNSADFILTSYHSPQGYFELLIHRNKCEIIPTDTTVEYLAEFLAAESAKLTNLGIIEVFAYEGIDKGAYYKLSR